MFSTNTSGSSKAEQETWVNALEIVTRNTLERPYLLRVEHWLRKKFLELSCDDDERTIIVVKNRESFRASFSQVMGLPMSKTKLAELFDDNSNSSAGAGAAAGNRQQQTRNLLISFQQFHDAYYDLIGDEEVKQTICILEE